MKSILSYIVLILSACLHFHAYAQEKTFHIYLDADRSSHYPSAHSIEQGVKTAFSEIDNNLQGYNIEFVLLDHRGNSARSKRNMSIFNKDPNGLVFIAGMHSPPLIKYREYINRNKILTLVPWAAGGPITRYPSVDNWVFRLSVDDTKAGKKIAQFAIQTKQCKKPYLLLENTPWGESNRRNMQQALSHEFAIQADVGTFNWGLTEEQARIQLRKVSKTNADCILMVSNATEGENIINAMASLPKDNIIPIYSHWGITGGNFAQKVKYDTRQKVDLHFIQSCFSFTSSKPSPFTEEVFKHAQILFPQELKAMEDLQAPSGFIHGYDIAKLFIQAASQVTLGTNKQTNQEQLRNALENIKTPVQGLIKEYQQPFSPYSETNLDAHEALDANDLCMGSYNHHNNIEINM